MDRRQAFVAVAGVTLAGVAAAADPPGDLRVPTEDGHRDITGKTAAAYHAANTWLEARLKEAEGIRVGSTYAEVVEVFVRDGGLVAPLSHRFVLILCPYLKVDIVFEDKPGVKSRYPVPVTARVASVTKPYFERGFAD